MLNTMSPGCTGLKTIFGGMRGPRGEHWGSCKGRGLAQKDYHGWMKLDSEMVLKHCACCSDPPQCYMCLQTWLALTSFFVDSFHWQHHVMCSFFCFATEAQGHGFLGSISNQVSGNGTYYCFLCRRVVPVECLGCNFGCFCLKTSLKDNIAELLES